MQIQVRTQTHHTLYLSIIRCHLGYTTQVWSPQSIGLLKWVENVQRCATKLILKLPFHCDVTYKTCLQLRNLLPISYWHEFLDIVFFFKAVHNLVFIDKEAPPATRRSMRSTKSSSSNAITYIPKWSRIVTYQRSLFICACHTWNVLPAELRTSHISLASLSIYQFNNTIRLWTCTTLTTSEPGEQSFPDATKQRLPRAHRLAASSNLNFCFVSFWFFFLYISSFSY